MIDHPIRSIMFVPSDRGILAAKAAASGADAICLDLEDGLDPTRRPDGRRNLAKMAASLDAKEKPLWVRINSDLLDAARDIEALPPTCRAVVVPKCRDLTHIALIGEALDAQGATGTSIVAMLEDPAAVDAFERTAHFTAHPRLAALALGTEDLSAALGGEPDAPIIAAILNRLVATAATRGLPALGYAGSIAMFRDTDRFSVPLHDARANGAAGGFCIHPSQIAALNAAFAPTAEQRDRAEQVVRQFEAGNWAASGLNGTMVDRPVYLRACRALGRPPVCGTVRRLE